MAALLLPATRCWHAGKVEPRKACLQVAESLHHFAGQGDAAAVRERLDGGASVNERDSDGATPLHWAADRGAAAMVEVLLDRGANVAACDAGGMTPLHYAATSGNEKARAHIFGMLIDLPSWRRPDGVNCAAS